VAGVQCGDFGLVISASVIIALVMLVISVALAWGVSHSVSTPNAFWPWCIPAVTDLLTYGTTGYFSGKRF
jgi:hypothetical protein